MAESIGVPPRPINKIVHGKRGFTADGAPRPAARLIESLLDTYERPRRMESFGRAFRGADAEYWDEFTSWDLSEGAVPDDV